MVAPAELLLAGSDQKHLDVASEGRNGNKDVTFGVNTKGPCWVLPG